MSLCRRECRTVCVEGGVEHFVCVCRRGCRTFCGGVEGGVGHFVFVCGGKGGGTFCV